MLHILSDMFLISHTKDFRFSAKGAVLCIGNFDGVHLGHQQMLSAGRKLARQRKLQFVVITFNPHPMRILKPPQPRPPLMTTTQRLEGLMQYEPDVLWMVKTDQAFLNITAEDFMRNIMVNTIRTKVVVEGSNFTFGKGARGTVDTLRNQASQHGWKVVVIPTQQAVLQDLSLVDVSSSLIRWLISHGRVTDAHRLLGHAYTLRGTVAHGAGRGKIMGYPTLNIQSEQLLPAHGVYAGKAIIGEQSYPAAISVGNNPTFNGTETTVEAFVLDFSDTVYEKQVDIEFFSWLRDQHKFSGPAALTAQIQRDVEQIRRCLKDRPHRRKATVGSTITGKKQPHSIGKAQDGR
jgi:riboflavin kinase/FMN adenylyltransferase